MELRKQKKRILENVMETETYKVAKELLEKFDPSSLKSADSPPRSTTFNTSLQQTNLNQSLRHRTSIASSLNTPPAKGNVVGTGGSPVPRSSFQQQTTAPYSSSFNPNQMPINAPSQAQLRQVSFSPRPSRPARPVLPAERSVLDRMIDFMVGDGPNNRYALICCSCHGHNGMALKDEFEFLAFRCCYCNSYNPPRKIRPLAPRIEPSPSSLNAEPVIGHQQESESENADLKSPSNVEEEEVNKANDATDPTVSSEKRSGEISSSEEEEIMTQNVKMTEDNVCPENKSRDDDIETTQNSPQK